MSSIQPLIARGIDRAYGDRRVLTGVDLVVPPGARLGLIGENGVGKSTLLRILAGVEQPDGGSISRPERLGFLWQEAPVSPDATIADLLDEYTADLRALQHEFDEAATALSRVEERPAKPDATTPRVEERPAKPDASRNPAPGDPAERYERALAAAEAADLWTLESRRDETLAALGVAALGLDRRVADISGGQRSRVALAGLLLARPDALLLDEPTNHLDDEAVAYLAGELRTWRGPVLFASHDRAFLDEVATELVDLDPAAARPATRYGGGFTDYLAEKARERERWEQRFATEQDELARLETVAATTARSVAHGRGPRDNDKFIHKFKGANVQRSVARRVHDAERRRDVLEASAVRKPPPILRFAGIPSGATAVGDETDTLLDATDIRVDGRLALDRLTITARDRVLVTGANGAGKSTLLALLAGELAPDAGEIRRRKGLRVGLLRQDIRFPEPDRTPRALYDDAVGHRRAELTPLSSLGLVPPAQVDRPVGSLSIGQQRRLALAIVLANPPHVFLLDEPSNHLSLSLAVELEEALGSYPGAVVVASHDRWLRRRWAGRVLPLTTTASTERRGSR